ncbi:MAG: hypothetical protein NTV98_03420, partial [Candidatus Roizmanbacteria bacterium]|nr:hypothetical protein [Candidatus Roizmanbacteria bacterium]
MSMNINGTDLITNTANVTLNIGWTKFPWESNPTVARYANDLSPSILNSCSNLGGGSWSAWEPISTSKSWTLATGSNGLRGVCVETAHGTVSSPTSILSTGNVIIYADITPPTVTPHITGTLGTNGWYKSNVVVTWAVTDESTISSQIGCGTTNITTDTIGQTITCKATSEGGTTTQSVTIKKDSTIPTITYVNRTPPNSSGWNSSDVVVNWNCSDVLSGPVSSTVTQTVSMEGTGLSSIGTCTDMAGNSASNTQTGINIDKSAPITPSLISPVDGIYRHTSNSNFSDWSDVTDPSGVIYRYQSAADSGFTTLPLYYDSNDHTPVLTDSMIMNRDEPEVS